LFKYRYLPVFTGIFIGVLGITGITVFEKVGIFAIPTRNSVDQCTDLFNDVIWSCFGSFVPKTLLHCVQKFPWVTKGLNSLKTRATRTSKKFKKKASGGA
jgi:hypothetical protein